MVLPVPHEKTAFVNLHVEAFIGHSTLSKFMKKSFHPVAIVSPGSGVVEVTTE